jgi:hypothetical protein
MILLPAHAGPIPDDIANRIRREGGGKLRDLQTIGDGLKVEISTSHLIG